MPKLFIITGVTAPGEAIDLSLLNFLYSERDRFLIWIDDKANPHRNAKDVADVIEAGRSNVVYRPAPPAIWGGPSIVASMLEALKFALARWPHWNTAVFCSIRDVPLVSRAILQDGLNNLEQYDYCGSRWNASPMDVIKPSAIASNSPDHITYDVYNVRDNFSIRVDTSLSDIFSRTYVSSLRLCNQLYERYFVSCVEDRIRHSLIVNNMSAPLRERRISFFSTFGLYSGRQWCICSRRFSELVLEDYFLDIFYNWFFDVLIADECFFQTVAMRLATQGKIRAHFSNIYSQDAAVQGISRWNYAAIIAQRKPNELLARKKVEAIDFSKFDGLKSIPS